MEATRGSWADVEEHIYIQDMNGKTWRVERASDKRVRLVDRDGKRVDLLRPPANREVTLLVPTIEEARFTLAKALGARVLASRDEETKRYLTPPPETWDLESALWHMTRFHRVHCENMTLAEIQAFHETSEPTCPHEHTEEM